MKTQSEYLVIAVAYEFPEELMTTQFIVSIPKQKKPHGKAARIKAESRAGSMLTQNIAMGGADTPFFNTLVWAKDEDGEIVHIGEVSGFYVNSVRYLGDW